jgi:hypothetical protein
MAILERRVQLKVRNEQQYNEWEAKWAALEARLGGFPPKRHYYLISGSEAVGTMVWERDWASFAAMEAAYDRMFQDGEAESLGSSAPALIESERIEYYFTHDGAA